MYLLLIPIAMCALFAYDDFRRGAWRMTGDGFGFSLLAVVLFGFMVGWWR